MGHANLPIYFHPPFPSPNPGTSMALLRSLSIHIYRKCTFFGFFPFLILHLLASGRNFHTKNPCQEQFTSYLPQLWTVEDPKNKNPDWTSVLGCLCTTFGHIYFCKPRAMPVIRWSRDAQDIVEETGQLLLRQRMLPAPCGFLLPWTRNLDSEREEFWTFKQLDPFPVHVTAISSIWWGPSQSSHGKLFYFWVKHPPPLLPPADPQRYPPSNHLHLRLRPLAYAAEIWCPSWPLQRISWPMSWPKSLRLFFGERQI